MGFYGIHFIPLFTLIQHRYSLGNWINIINYSVNVMRITYLISSSLTLVSDNFFPSEEHLKGCIYLEICYVIMVDGYIILIELVRTLKRIILDAFPWFEILRILSSPENTVLLNV